jgi:uncharacterized protein
MNERGTQNILRKIKESIQGIDSSAEVFLFGSRARGEESESSDWDVLVLIQSSTVSRSTEMAIREAVFDVELELGIPISTFVFSKADWETRYAPTPLYQNIKKEAVLL